MSAGRLGGRIGPASGSRWLELVRMLWLGARMLTWAIALQVLRYLLSLPRLVQLMTRSAHARSRHDAADRQRVLALAHALYGPLAPPDSGCLQRSLLIFRFLGETGASPRLVVGVRKVAGRVLGHCWVTVDGERVGEPADTSRDYSMIFESGSEQA